MRALAVFPLRTPVIGKGNQRFNPIHATDLALVIADCLARPPGPGPWEVGGSETCTQAEIIASICRWLGLSPQRLLRLPVPFVRQLGRAGDLLRLGPISATSVAQLSAGVHASHLAILEKTCVRPRGFSEFLMARPAGTQDLWQARLYLMKPLVRLTLGLMWLCSGLLGLFLPPDAFPALPLPGAALALMARAGGIVDLGLALGLFLDWRPRLTGWCQLALVGIYTLGLSFLAPELWLAPFGALLKNLPVLALIGIHIALAEER